MFLDKIRKNSIYGISKELGESLNEMAKTAIDDENNYCIVVTPDSNRNVKNIEYFKFLNHKNYDKSDKIARIMFRKSEYIHHNDRDGKKEWILNSKEKKRLIELLNKKDRHGDSIWVKTILAYNSELGLSEEKSLENTMDSLKYPNFLPIDLPIPDYMKL